MIFCLHSLSQHITRNIPNAKQSVEWEGLIVSPSHPQLSQSMFDIHVFALETLENIIITNCEPCPILHSDPYLIADLVLVSLPVSHHQIGAEKRGNTNNSFQHSFLFFSPLFYPATTHSQTFMPCNVLMRNVVHRSPVIS